MSENRRRGFFGLTLYITFSDRNCIITVNQFSVLRKRINSAKETDSLLTTQKNSCHKTAVTHRTLHTGRITTQSARLRQTKQRQRHHIRTACWKNLAQNQPHSSGSLRETTWWDDVAVCWLGGLTAVLNTVKQRSVRLITNTSDSVQSIYIKNTSDVIAKKQ